MHTSTPKKIRTSDLRFRKPELQNDNTHSGNDLQQNQRLLGVDWEYQECQLLALLDADLENIFESWNQLPGHIKQTITTLVKTQGQYNS